VNRSSLDCLTSNRDSFKHEFRAQYQKVLADLQINKRSALRQKPPMRYERIRGVGTIKVAKEAIEGALQPPNEEGFVVDLGAVAAALKSEGVEFDDIMAHRLNEAVITPDELAMMVSKLQFIGYKPDFILKYRGEAHIERGFMQTDKARMLATIWTEVVKQVLLDNDMYLDFVAGFTFDGDDEAEHVEHRGEHYFLLNPNNLLKVFKMVKKPLSDRKLLLRDLRSRAVHEIAHVHESNHDENFVIRLHFVEAKTWKSDIAYSQIQRLR